MFDPLEYYLHGPFSNVTSSNAISPLKPVPSIPSKITLNWRVPKRSIVIHASFQSFCPENEIPVQSFYQCVLILKWHVLTIGFPDVGFSTILHDLDLQLSNVISNHMIPEGQTDRF